MSGMDRREELITGFLTVTVRRQSLTGEVIPAAMEFTPLVVHFSNASKTDICVYPLSEYTEEMAEENYVNELRGEFTLQFIDDVIRAQIPEAYLGRSGSILQ